MFNYDILYNQVMFQCASLERSAEAEWKQKNPLGSVDAAGSAQAEAPGSMQEAASQPNP